MGILISMTTQYDNYQYITSNGIIVPDTSTIQEQVEQDFKNALGQDLDTTPETPQGRLIQLITDYRTNTLAINAENANQINLRYATGRFLDAIGSFFGVSRIGAKSTRVLANVVGVQGTVIPQGSQAQTTDGDVFYAENSITIGSSGTANGYFLSLEKGAIPCDVNSLNTIVNAVLGWESINNTASAIIGINTENDIDFRARIEASRVSGISLMSAIKARLANVPNVLSSFAYDNYEDTSITYDGITIDPHSILVVVDGGTNQAVSEAIYKAKTGGTGYTAITGQSVSEQVIDGSYGVPYTVTFNRPDVIPFKVAIDVSRNVYTGADLEDNIKQAIIDWSKGLVNGVDGLKIGQNVSPYEIGAAVSAVIPEIYVKSVEIALVGQAFGTSELTFTIAEIGQIIESNITVTVI